MITLDACALEAYLLGEPAQWVVADAIHSAEQLVITAVNAGEVVDHLLRVHRAPSVDEVWADLIEIGLVVTAVDAELAAAAAELRARHYHHRHRAVSLADCCAVAHALDRGSTLMSSDAAALRVAVDEGGSWRAVLDSKGRMPDPTRLPPV